MSSCVQAYREFTAYTCNCSLQDPYAFLGGTGGTRPSTVVTWSVVATCICCALCLPAIGRMVDGSNKRRQVFFIGSLMTALWTLLGSIMGGNYLWAVGLVFTSLTAVFYEVAYVGLGPYPPEIAKSDADRAKVSGLRQMGSTAAQLVFAASVVSPQTIYPGMNDFEAAIFANVLCTVWICICIPLAYKLYAIAQL